MASKNGKKKYSLGSVVALPLPDGRFAFARIYQDYNYGVYDFLSQKIVPVEEVLKRKVSFFQSATDAAVKSGKWVVIGEAPFANKDDAWPPPRAAGVLPGDELGPLSPLLSYNGNMRNAALDEVMGLDKDEFCQRPELFIDVVVDRLINGNHDAYRVPDC